MKIMQFLLSLSLQEPNKKISQMSYWPPLHAVSTGDMYIYIEADITKDLHDILHCIPGLIRRGGNSIYKFIPPSNHIQVLHLPKDWELQFEVGQWVWIIRGMYKGNVGYINKLLSWGGVCLLMVPRIWPLDFSMRKRGKQPHSTPPPPLTLFDPLAIMKTFCVVPKTKRNILMFKGDKFKIGRAHV